uniref:ADAM10 cysteine-rich domain-containing protein n=1 Tax=Magallana gigas TaxID=29159 RepID=A0A8W8NU99_MAGGI
MASLVCQQGFCTGSLCLKVGTPEDGISPGDWEECFVTLPGDLTVQQMEQLCYLACKKKNDSDDTCYATNQNLDSSNALYALLQDVNQRKQSSGGIKLTAGSPCNNYQGYCDVFSRCRGVDNEGPLQRLKNLIFNEKTLANIKNWIIEYWWAVLLMAIGLILFMGLFIKFCAVHTPSSNPNAKPALKLTDTLRRRRRQPEQQYRAQGPSGPPPPYSAQGGQPQGHRKGAGAKGGRYNNLEMRKV